MLRIGDFSKLCRVPVSALRYYADHGLLTPVYIDASTGYRYYALDQLPRLNRILALKDLGMSLASIRRLLDEQITPDELQGMLRLREAELEQDIGVAQMRLERVRERLRQIEQESQPEILEVAIRAIDPQAALAVRAVIPDGQHVEYLLREVFAVIGTEGIELTSPPMTIFHDPEFKDENLDVEIACPVALPIGTAYRTANSRELKVCTLEALPAAACTLHTGSYDLFADTYAALGRWIEQHGCVIAGAPREIYLRPPAETEPALTEIQMPVERKRSKSHGNHA